MIWRSYELHQKTYCDPVQLYYLKDDPLEQTNVAHKRPRLVQQLSQLLRQEFAITNVKWTPPWDDADATNAEIGEPRTWTSAAQVFDQQNPVNLKELPNGGVRSNLQQ